MEEYYLLKANHLHLSGLQTVPTLKEVGIQAIQTQKDENVEHGLVLSDKLGPARRQNKPLLFVEWHDSHWLAQKLD